MLRTMEVFNFHGIYDIIIKVYHRRNIIMEKMNNDIFQLLTDEEEVEELSNKIIPAKDRPDFFDDMSRFLLKAVIYYLISSTPKEEQTISNAIELLKKSEVTDDNNELKKRINELPYDHVAKMNFKTVELLPEKTYAETVKTLEKILESLI